MVVPEKALRKTFSGDWLGHGNVTRVAEVVPGMPKMSSDEREQYLAEVRVGVIAVERPDRAPLSVPIWYAYEPGGEVTLWTLEGSIKDKLIRAAGRFSITVQDEQPPYRYVTAEGDVTRIDPPNDAEVRAIAIRYFGEAEGNKFVDDEGSQAYVLIRMKPQRWLSTDYSKT